MISFCIITTPSGRENTTEVVSSIHALRIPDVEIIVCGGSPIEDTIHIPFDETYKPGWVTRKKNLCNQVARHENVIHQHDYFAYDVDFYEGFLRFDKENPHWHIMMCKIMNKDGSRYRDWCAWRDERNTPAWIQREPWTGPRGLLVEGRPFLAHYDYKQTHLMYISGGWQMTRRQVMVDNPWNEELMWAGAEDCFLSKQLLQDVPQKYNYMMNTYSTVKLLKQKDVVLMERSDLR